MNICYDSSYNSFGLHGRYGRISLKGSAKLSIAHKLSDNFYELPISNLSIKNPLSFARPVKLFEKNSEANLTGDLSAFSSERYVKKRMVSKSFVLPFGGGAYFRLIPLPMFRLGIKSILKKEGSYLFYLHPWEIDPEQPRVREASLQQKFRHYSKLSKTFARLKLLIKSFNNCAFTTCAEYIVACAKHRTS